MATRTRTSKSVKAQDPSLYGEGWSVAAARRLSLVVHDEHDLLEKFLSECETADTADELAVYADHLLLEGDYSQAICFAQKAAAATTEDDAILAIWVQAIEASARALRGEAEGLLSLRMLVGSCARNKHVLLEAAVSLLIAQTAGISGDVATAKRAALRSIERASSIDAIALETSARFALGDLLIASSAREDITAAASQFSRLETLTQSQGWQTMYLSARVSTARAAYINAEHETAASIADETLELALASTTAHFVAVEAAIIAARALAATKSYALALAALSRAEHVAADSYWLALEKIRICAQSEDHSAELRAAFEALAALPESGDGGALEAAHAEARVWHAFAADEYASLEQLINDAQSLWVSANCHDELAVTEQLRETMKSYDTTSVEAAQVGSSLTAEQLAQLTKREGEIAQLVARAFSNVEIAGQLHLSARTVEHHVASIMRKLALTSRRELVHGRTL